MSCDALHTGTRHRRQCTRRVDRATPIRTAPSWSGRPSAPSLAPTVVTIRTKWTASVPSV